ncbi:MAG TPA: T9SS type A sorting domain-containing protein, partial [Candidatus Kapabacteria bacterium]
IHGEFISAVTELNDVTKPIISLRMKTTLSIDRATAITLDTFSINGGMPLPLCVTPQSVFSLSDTCGDSVLSEFMRSGKIPTIISVRPNPLTGSTLEVTINSPQETSLRFEIVDINGTTIGTHGNVPMTFTKGEHTIKLNVNSLQTGTYYVRLSDGNGSVQVKKLQ